MGVAEKAHVGAVRSDPTRAASIGGKTASVDRASAAERHPTGRDRSVQSRLRRLWAALLGQAMFGFRIVLIAVAIFVASQVPITAAVRDLAADLWTTSDVQIGVAIILALVGFFAGLTWPRTYLPTMWAIAPLIPGLATISVVATYLVAPVGRGAAAFIVGSEIAATAAIIGAIPLRMLATVRVAQTRSYWELRRRTEQLRTRLKVAERDLAEADRTTPQRMAVAEANKQLDEVKRALLRPPSRSQTNGLEWVSAMGYVSLWRRVDRAEEALIDFEPRELVLSDALHDKLRMTGAGIRKDQLEPALDAAVRIIDAKAFDRYFTPRTSKARVVSGESGMGAGSPQPSAVGASQPLLDGSLGALSDQADERLPRAILREVRHVMNAHVEDAMEGIVRARNRLWRAILLTATTTFLLVGMAILNDVPKPQLIGASVFFLVAAIVGLFNRLRLQAQADSAVEDFNLFEARLVHTPLISGLAGVAGVILVAIAPAASGQSPTSLNSVFELSNNPVGLLVAAAFGLAPDRIIGPLQDQTEKLKGQLKAGKAAVETTASTATADTPGV
jgi:hypothetical protein